MAADCDAVHEGSECNFGIDPLYLLIVAPGLLLALWAQYRVSTAYSEGARITASSGVTGAQAAAEVMRAEGLVGAAIESVEGMLTDHYDPRHRVLRLSHENNFGRSLAALGVAAHEAGHALPDGTAPALLAASVTNPRAGGPPLSAPSPSRVRAEVG